MKSLKELVSHDNFCIVGNSPKEVGTGKGPLIDSYDSIIRFKNYDLTGDHAHDYGTRTDGWVTPFNLTQFYRDPAQYQSVCCCLPLEHKKWRRRFPGSNIDYILISEYTEIEYIPVDIFEEIWSKYDRGQPSSGIITLYWIYRLTDKKIPRDNVFGFSMFDPDEAHHYYKRDNQDDDQYRLYLAQKWASTTPETHPRDIELKIFEELTE